MPGSPYMIFLTGKKFDSRGKIFSIRIIPGLCKILLLLLITSSLPALPEFFPPGRNPGNHRKVPRHHHSLLH